MSLLLTFLCATNHVKALTLDGASAFRTNLARENETETGKLDKAIEKDSIENKLEEERDQALVSRIEGDKYTRVSEDISFSRLSIAKSVRLGRKFKFQDKNEELPRMAKMVRFFKVVIL